MKVFREEQRFHPIWFFLIIGVILSISFIFSKMTGNEEGGILFLVLKNSLTIVLFFLVFIVAKLITIADTEMILVKWTLFGHTIYEKKIRWSEVIKSEIIYYTFVGFGYRFSSKYGIVINARGNQGLSITTNANKKFVFGTQKPKELANYVNTIKNH